MLSLTNFREQYPALSSISDTLVLLAIDKAYATISRYVPSTVLGVRAQAAIDGVASVLARAYVVENQAFGDEHPIAREQKEALNWLSMVATGKAQLPTDPPDANTAPATSQEVTVSGGFATNSAKKVFNSSFIGSIA